MSAWLSFLTSTWQGIQWHWPWVLPLALLPFLSAYARQRTRRRAVRYADAHLLPWVITEIGWSRTHTSRFWCEAAAWALLVLALAGPRWPALDAPPGEELSRLREDGDIVVLVQVSDSMRTADLAPDRLTRARLALLDGMRRLRGERLTLIAYGASAGMLLPPTRDRTLFAGALQWLDADLLPAAGSNLAQALALALRQLGDDERLHHAVLLITDADSDSLAGGQGDAVKAAADALKRRGIPLHVWFALPRSASGAATGEYRKLVEATGGGTAYLEDDDFGWNAIYTHGIGAIPAPRTTVVTAATGDGWRELFAWPLGLGIVLLAMAYTPRPRWPWPWPRRWPPVLWMTVVALSLNLASHPQQAQAQPAPVSERSAWEAYSHKQWALARRLYEQIDGYRGHWGAGLAALQAGNAIAAMEHLGLAWMLAPDETSQLDALYNLAYAYAVLGRWDAAAEGWQSVLDRRPTDTRAVANLRIAREQLRRQNHSASRRQDLFGHLGFAVEGTVEMDGMGRPQDLPEPQAGTTAPTTGAAPEAQPPGASTARRTFVATQRDLESAQIKTGHLSEQKEILQKALIRQDANVPLTLPGSPPTAGERP